jgi:F0F1-type ATP synthase membrane subunit c/vacuolar-type H+-ATPase subunit K
MDIDTQTLTQVASYIGGGMAIGFGAIGAALGEGYAAANADSAISEEPEKYSDIIRNMLVGQAVAESAAIFALVVAILLLFISPGDPTILTAAAMVAAGAAMGLGALGSGLGSGFPAGKACMAIVKTKDPEVLGRMTTIMLIGQAVCQTPAILAMVVSLMMLFMKFGDPTIVKAAAIIAAGFCMGLGGIGSGIGSGFPAGESCMAMTRQPKISGNITTIMLIGAAVSQTPAILAMVIALMLMFINFGDPEPVKAMALLGAGLCMGFGAIGSGAGSGHPGGAACRGLGIQPEAQGYLTTNMLVGAAVCQTPAIFAMVVALMLMFVNFGDVPFNPYWAAFLGAGLCTGLAAMGSGWGGGLAAGASCEGIARQPRTVGIVTTTMLVGQAVAQTPCIFGLLVSFILLFKVHPEAVVLAPSMALLGAALCMGFGGIGPGLGNGIAATNAIKWVARNEKNAGLLMRMMLVAQAVSQSTAIYSMVIALVLLFVVI